MMAEMKAASTRGKKFNQKIKPYVVLQYLLKYTDEDNIVTAPEIVDFLEEHGMEAERRSIYSDIKEINKVALMLEEDCSIDDAEEMLDNDTDDELKLVVYDPHRKGFFIRQRHFDLNDIRLLAECIYSAKFITEGQAKRLVEVVCEFVSEHQAERIRYNAFLTDRVKTNNKHVLNSIAVINDAMSRRMNGAPHKPEKVSFKYLKHEISNVSNEVERRHGDKYIVSPYALLINEGNYYLLAVDDRYKKLRTYRIDRMKEVSLTGEQRTGEEHFKDVDIHTYAQRVFGMYGGKQQLVTIRFINPLLDTAVERFGTKDAIYAKVDDRHFSVTAQVEISDLFYGWLLGFGKRVKLTYPDEAVEGFKAYLKKVSEMYEEAKQ